jgi:hypothetical protein
VVIQVDKTTAENTFYKVTIANKTGVPPYGPFLKSPPIYEKNDEFRDFFLTKLINSERAAMLSPDFKGKMIRTNKQLLAEITKTFIPRANERTQKSGTRPSSGADIQNSQRVVAHSLPPERSSPRLERSELLATSSPEQVEHATLQKPEANPVDTQPTEDEPNHLKTREPDAFTTVDAHESTQTKENATANGLDSTTETESNEKNFNKEQMHPQKTQNSHDETAHTDEFYGGEYEESEHVQE